MMEPSSHKIENLVVTKSLLTRFSCIYFILYIFPFPLDLVSENNFVTILLREFWGKLVPIVGKVLLNIEVGSRGGDTLFHYVRIFSILLIAIVGSLIWTFLDRKRINNKELFYWNKVYVRYYLAYNLLDYGFAKIFNIQFAPLFPNLDQLVQPYGDFSPQGLLWKFMGYSKSYQIFTGLGEVAAGFLLFFHRTKLLGAIISIAILSNVVMMNWSYDIPVKIYSSHLLIMSILLLSGNAKRLVNFFFLNKTVEPLERPAICAAKWAKAGMFCLKLFFVGFLIYVPLNIYSRYHKDWYGNSKPPLYGLFQVEEFAINNDMLPPLTTDSVRWKRVIIEYPGMWANIQLMNETLKTFELNTDTLQRLAVITSRSDSLDKFTLHYDHPAKDVLTFIGQRKGDSVFIKMRKVDINQFRLVQWRSHWIYRGGSSNY